MTDHDHPYKCLFSVPDIVADLLRAQVPDLAADAASLVRVNGTYVSDRWRDREDDIVWSVRCGSQRVLVYILIEFQSAIDPDMALRMLGYMALLWQDQRTTGACPAGEPLPPILPVVLYNGDPPWTASDRLAALLHPYPAAIAAYRPDLRYLILDEQRLAISPHEPLRNLATAIFALEQARSSEALVHIANAVRDWLDASGRSHIIPEYATWFHRTLTDGKLPPEFPNPFSGGSMIVTTIRRELEQAEAKGEARGKAEGKAEGKALGAIAAIRSLIADGTLTIDQGRTRIHALIARGEIDAQLGRQALDRLG